MEAHVLDEYITSLVEKTYGELLADDPEALEEAKRDLTGAFNKLYNARLLEKLTPEQMEEAHNLMEKNQFDKVVELAYNIGINFTVHAQEVMREFEELYAPSDK